MSDQGRPPATPDSPVGAVSGEEPVAPRISMPLTPVIPADQLQAVKSALVRYRVMAYLVGALLVALMLFAMPMKYVWHDDRWVTWFGLPHGWLYMVLLITAWDLGRRVNWSLRNLVGIGLAGTVPFLSFVAEYLARKDVQRKLASSNPRVVR